MGTRRNVLECWAEPEKLRSHAGLWLDKFIRNQAAEDTTSKWELVEQVSKIPVPDLYPQWFGLWQGALKSCGARLRTATTRGRLVVGLGNESVLETSVMLHRTFGVPYIPGSALKGAAARFAREFLGDEWEPHAAGGRTPGAYEVVFGDTNSAGYVTFFDALPLPDSCRLYRDVIAVHHPDYYRAQDSPPADWDGPNPVPFLSAGGKFLMALAGPARWVDATFDVLKHALAEIGVGAKTSSGYGRMILEESAPGPGQEDTSVDRLIRELAALKSSGAAGQIQRFYQEWSRLEASDDRRRLARAIVGKVREIGKEKDWMDREWYKTLLENQ